MRRSRFLRPRSVIALSALTGFVAACGFGVDLDGIFGGSNGVGPNGDGGNDGTADVVDIDATIPKVQVVQIGVGSEFGCGRRIDGTVMCWGRGSDGRLGDNTETSSSKPVLVKDLSDAVDLSVGSDHACAVKKDASVVCWGYNNERELGDGTQTNALLPRAVVGLTDVKQVEAGGQFTCALKNDGTVSCWGDNGDGQLGDNTQAFHGTPGPVMGLADVTQIAVVYEAVCALVKSGDVYCWGDNGEGLTGIGTSGQGVNTLLPTKVPDLSGAGVKMIGRGPNAGHFCAVLTSGAVRCWGDANSGQIGNAMGGEMQTKPQAVVGLTDADRVAMGSGFTCATRKTGEVSCWGTNGWRQLGQGDTNPPGGTNVPVPISGLSGVDQIAAGNDFACALHTGGEKISCWGSNRSASLGRNTRLASEIPLKVPNLSAVHVGMGRFHNCATTSTGDVWCWGFNDYRQQATNAFNASGTPTKVAAIGGAQKVTGGEIHTCGIFGSDVKCWGHNSEGAVGAGNFNYIHTDPQTFIGGTGATDVAAGYHFTCALLPSTQVACAGYNDDGRLGSAGGDTATARIVQVANPNLDAGVDADDADAGPPPPAVIPLSNVTRLGIGRIHSCAVHSGGAVSCWGSPWDGRLGINTNTPRTNPIAVGLPMAATDVCAGFDHSCAVLADGSARCWGANYRGQASGGGDNGATQRTPNFNGKQAKAITCGGSHTCALMTDETVTCWGNGRDGQLGQGMRVDSNQPVPVKDLTGVKVIDAEEDRTCAVVADGSVFCWGDDSGGGLGDGVVMHTGVPDSVFGY